MPAFHSSVAAKLAVVAPPAAKAALAVPSPACPYLAVLRSFVSENTEPFHNSVFATSTVLS